MYAPTLMYQSWSWPFMINYWAPCHASLHNKGTLVITQGSYECIQFMIMNFKFLWTSNTVTNLLKFALIPSYSGTILQFQHVDSVVVLSYSEYSPQRTFVFETCAF